MTYRFVDMYGSVKCRFASDVYWSSIREYSYTFTPGAYALVGQIDDGGWALSYSLAPIKKKDVYINKWVSPDHGIPESKFFIDDREVSLAYIQSISHHLGYYNKNKFASCNKSARKQLTKAIKKGTSKYSFAELQEMFGLSEGRIDRPLHMTSREAWRITAAVGLAQGKKIFCFPWKSNNYIIGGVVYALEILAKIAKEEGCILLMPLENDELVKHFVDGTIDLSYKTYVERLLASYGDDSFDT